MDKLILNEADIREKQQNNSLNSKNAILYSAMNRAFSEYAKDELRYEYG